MRVLTALVLMVLITGCATLKPKAKSELPRAARPWQEIKVDDCYRAQLHSNNVDLDN